MGAIDNRFAELRCARDARLLVKTIDDLSDDALALLLAHGFFTKESLMGWRDSLIRLAEVLERREQGGKE